jgi:hypothetical protein
MKAKPEKAKQTSDETTDKKKRGHEKNKAKPTTKTTTKDRDKDHGHDHDKDKDRDRDTTPAQRDQGKASQNKTRGEILTEQDQVKSRHTL